VAGADAVLLQVGPVAAAAVAAAAVAEVSRKTLNFSASQQALAEMEMLVLEVEEVEEVVRVAWVAEAVWVAEFHIVALVLSGRYKKLVEDSGRGLGLFVVAHAREVELDHCNSSAALCPELVFAVRGVAVTLRVFGRAVVAFLVAEYVTVEGDTDVEVAVAEYVTAEVDADAFVLASV